MLSTIFSSENLSLRTMSSKFVLLSIYYLLYAVNLTSIWLLISFRITPSQIVFGLPAGCCCFVFPPASFFQDFVCFRLRLKRYPDHDSFHCLTILHFRKLIHTQKTPFTHELHELHCQLEKMSKNQQIQCSHSPHKMSQHKKVLIDSLDRTSA